MPSALSSRVAVWRTRTVPLVPGLGVVAAGVAVSVWLGALQSVLGSLVIALMLGVLLGNSGLYTMALRPGVKAGTKKLLRAGVVLLGLQLALPDILALGFEVLALIVACVVMSFVFTLHVGMRLGLTRAGATLMAAGFSICGASAVAGLQGIVNADDDETASAVAMVTLYGSVMILALPVLNGLLGLSDDSFGMWSGLAIHEVAQVVAAAGTAGATALAVATVIKLGRVLMLAPVAAVTSLSERRRPAAGDHEESTAARTGKAATHTPMIPFFVLGFLAMVALRSTGLVPQPALQTASVAATLLLAAGMFGLGAGIDIRQLVRTGRRAVMVGALSTIFLAGISLAGVLLVSPT
ncbi:putative sulfate exporter family transporter [Arthrobacter sp. Br18]|uniref:YeiH family protein n=1 Tax=Arthrobacter sp. Br18 TaxID=1312954 RepID=UPI0004AF987E|nr:putative sulfate exporter family transporter [Arthrobacter sp. Br18]